MTDPDPQNSQKDRKGKRNWLLIAFGVCVLLVFIGIGAIVGITAWVQQNLTVTETTEGSAFKEFDAIRARFSTRAPLLDMSSGRPIYSGGQPPERPTTAVPLEYLHVLAWDARDGQLASVAIPFWLLRLKSGPIQFSSYASGLDDNGVDLRPEDIEKYGPGIILDTTSPRGDRVLLWAQ
jgi:hypothetical protein